MNTPEPEGIAISVKKITLVEVGVIVSLIASIGTGIFTMGYLYGQVSENTAFRKTAMVEQTRMREDIAEIKAGISFLTEQAREQRMKDSKR